MNRKISLTLAFAAGFLLLTPFASGQEAVRVISTDICSSPHLKEILDAIECKKSNCPDPDGSKDAIYQQACTEIDPMTVREVGGDAVRVETDPSTRIGVFNLVNDSYPTIEILTRTRVTNPIKSNLLSPCDCLAKIEARVKCNIALCKTEPNPPAPENPPPANPPPAPEPPQAGKDVTPQRADPVLEGGGLCSLGSSAGTTDILGWIFLLGASGLLPYRRKRG